MWLGIIEERGKGMMGKVRWDGIGGMMGKVGWDEMGAGAQVGRLALGGARTVHHHMAIGAWAKRWAGGMKKVFLPHCFYFLKDLEAG